MMHIGIIAAMPAELHPLVREWPRTDKVHIGQLGEATCYAAAEGMGAAAAARSFDALRQAAGELDALVSYGWAGAISCGVKPPRVYAASEVIDARTGERFAAESSPAVLSINAAPPPALRLVTLDHVAGPAEKRPLAERYRAVLVDMESATVGRLARAHGLRFTCLRAVSDGYTDELPDMNPFITPAGEFRTAAFALHAALRPQSWPGLLELGRNSRAAAQALARELPQALGRLRLLS